MPLGERPDGGCPGRTRAEEADVLTHAAAVLTTSDWTRRRLLDRYALGPARVHVAGPAWTRRPRPGHHRRRHLLCVAAAVVPGKGHDQLATALAQVADLPWRCTCAGCSIDPDPYLSPARVTPDRGEGDRFDRLRFVGALRRTTSTACTPSDVLLLASRYETYGLVVTEALARGLPVLAWSVGGVPEALGQAPDGTRPGLLVPAGDAEALAAAVRAWLGDAQLREAVAPCRLRATTHAGTLVRDGPPGRRRPRGDRCAA